MSEMKKKEHNGKFETSSFLLESARNFTYHFFLLILATLANYQEGLRLNVAYIAAII